MKKIFAIIWKDTLIRFASIYEWLFFLFLPILFTFVLAGGTGGPSDPRVLLTVVDQARSPLSASLITTLDRSDTVRPEVTDLKEAEDLFSKRRISSFLIIPATFTLEDIVQSPVTLEMYEQLNNLNAMVTQREVEAIVGRTGSKLQIASSSVIEAEGIRPFLSTIDKQVYYQVALDDAERLLDEAPDRFEVVRGNTPDEIEYDPQTNSSAGQLITWVFVPLIGLSGTLCYEREKGTLKRLLTTPTSKATFMLGTITGQVVIALGQMTLLVIFGIYVMHVNWGRDIPALALILVVAAIAAAALGTMMGAFVKNENQATGLSIMLGMLMALLGGCWYPLDLFPAGVQDIVKALPTTWAMQGMLDVGLRGSDITGILPEVGVLLAFAILFFTIGLLRFRYDT
ncbi:MAG: ABC transporter permease [Anaerolineaceae bacterium]|nr:ABC transporter permease [Anaerolineaceae bacterium]